MICDGPGKLLSSVGVPGWGGGRFALTRSRVHPNFEVRTALPRPNDPDASADIIAQKMRQAGFPVSTRSVERVIEKYGLQKKTPSLPPRP